MKIKGKTILLQVGLPHKLKNLPSFSFKKDRKITCLIHIKINIGIFPVLGLFLLSCSSSPFILCLNFKNTQSPNLRGSWVVNCMIILVVSCVSTAKYTVLISILLIFLLLLQINKFEFEFKFKFKFTHL